MKDRLNGMKIAILVTDGFEQVARARPRDALDRAGGKTSIVSSKVGKVSGWNFTDWGDIFHVDVPLVEAGADDFGALLLPGGNLVTSRKPDDIPAFNGAMIELFARQSAVAA